MVMSGSSGMGARIPFSAAPRDILELESGIGNLVFDGIGNV